MRISVLILCILISSSLQQAFIQGNEQCVSCLRDNMKVCKNSFDDHEGYCCDPDDFFGNCGAVPGSIWSDRVGDWTYGKYLMWGSHERCGASSEAIFKSEKSLIRPDAVPRLGTCLIEVINYEKNSHTIKFSDTSITKADVNAYKPSEGDYFYNEGTFLDSDFYVDQYESLLILIMPNYGVDASFSTVARSSSMTGLGFPVGAIIGIVVGILSCILITVIFICCGIKIKKAIVKRQESVQNSNQNREGNVSASDYSQVPSGQARIVEYPNSRNVVESSNPVPIRNIQATAISQDRVPDFSINGGRNVANQLDQNVPLLENPTEGSDLAYPSIQNAE